MNKIQEDDYLHKINEKDYHVIVYTGSNPLNDQDDNVDVEIMMNDGKRYSGTIFTLKNIKSIMEKDKQAGECGHGLYFGGCKDMVIVETLNYEVIAKVIRSVYKEGMIETVFDYLPEE